MPQTMYCSECGKEMISEGSVRNDIPEGTIVCCEECEKKLNEIVRSGCEDASNDELQKQGLKYSKCKNVKTVKGTFERVNSLLEVLSRE